MTGTPINPTSLDTKSASGLSRLVLGLVMLVAFFVFGPHTAGFEMAADAAGSLLLIELLFSGYAFSLMMTDSRGIEGVVGWGFAICVLILLAILAVEWTVWVLVAAVVLGLRRAWAYRQPSAEEARQQHLGEMVRSLLAIFAPLFVLGAFADSAGRWLILWASLYYFTLAFFELRWDPWERLRSPLSGDG